MPNIDPANWTYATAAHLLLRAGFGHNGLYNKFTNEARLVRSYADMTPADAVDRLLNFNVSKVPPWAGNLEDGDATDIERLQRAWLLKMRDTLKPLREKMVLFLHTHFATGFTKVSYSKHMAVQNALFREFATGDFRELVKRVNIDAAMLIWLDGTTNKAGVPNENYARELQELFTIGVYDFAGQHNYAQNDVVQAARILTGWITYHDTKKITVEFQDGRHDTGSKTMYAPVAAETPDQNAQNQFTLGNQGDQEHRALIDGIFNHLDTEGRPTVARFIARAMWKFFAYDPEVDAGTPRSDLALIDALADEFKNNPSDPSNPYNLGALLRAMFLRDEFYASATRTIKSPTEYVIGTLRMLRGKLTGDTRTSIGSTLVSGMGQTLFDPPDVFSWRGNLAWVTTQTLLERYAFARDLSQAPKTAAYELGFNVYSYIDKTRDTTRQALVDRFLTLLGPVTVDAATNAQLLDWLGPDDTFVTLSDDNYVQVYVRGLMNLILSLPHYHVH
jgi:uncharacterized protein (DUF1800 family)